MANVTIARRRDTRELRVVLVSRDTLRSQPPIKGVRTRQLSLAEVMANEEPEAVAVAVAGVAAEEEERLTRSLRTCISTMY